MSLTHPCFSQLSLRIRMSTGAQLFPAVLVSTCAACANSRDNSAGEASFMPVSRKQIWLHCKRMQGAFLGVCWCLIFYKGSMLPAPRLSLQDPRPPAPELPDQFVEEHVETPSHQEAPLPDTILGGRAVGVQLGIRLSGRNRGVLRLGAGYAHIIYIRMPEVDPEFLSSNLHHHSG